MISTDPPYGIKFGSNWQVTRFQEKPYDPRTGYACPPICLFRQATLPLVGEYLEGGNNPDAPGHFVAWLVDRRPVHAFLFHEPRYSIGDLASYQEACEAFNKSGC